MEWWEAAALAALDGPDRPLSDLIAADDRWGPLSDAVSDHVNGAGLDRVSLDDWAAYEHAASDENWSVREGYGTLVPGYVGDASVRLGTSVTRVDRRRRMLRLHTEVGTIEADQVIVAVPTPVLAGDALVFDPPLPDKREAAANLPLGLADKVFLQVDRPD